MIDIINHVLWGMGFFAIGMLIKRRAETKRLVSVRKYIEQMDSVIPNEDLHERYGIGCYKSGYAEGVLHLATGKLHNQKSISVIGMKFKNQDEVK